MSEDRQKEILSKLGSDDKVLRTIDSPALIELSTEAKQTIGFSVMALADELHVQPSMIATAVSQYSEMYYTEPSGTLWIILWHPSFEDVEACILKIPESDWRLKGDSK